MAIDWTVCSPKSIFMELCSFSFKFCNTLSRLLVEWTHPRCTFCAWVMYRTYSTFKTYRAYRTMLQNVQNDLQYVLYINPSLTTGYVHSTSRRDPLVICGHGPEREHPKYLPSGKLSYFTWSKSDDLVASCRTIQETYLSAMLYFRCYASIHGLILVTNRSSKVKSLVLG